MFRSSFNLFLTRDASCFCSLPFSRGLAATSARHQNFENEVKQGDELDAIAVEQLPVSVRDLERFGDVWLRFTPTETLKIRKLSDYIRAVMHAEAAAMANPENSNDANAVQRATSISKVQPLSNAAAQRTLHSHEVLAWLQAWKPAHIVAAQNPKRGASADASLDEESLPDLQELVQEEEAASIVCALHLPINNARQTVHCLDVLYALALRQFRLSLEMWAPIPCDHQVVEMAKVAALKRYPLLRDHNAAAKPPPTAAAR